MPNKDIRKARCLAFEISAPFSTGDLRSGPCINKNPEMSLALAGLSSLDLEYPGEYPSAICLYNYLSEFLALMNP